MKKWRYEQRHEPIVCYVEADTEEEAIEKAEDKLTEEPEKCYFPGHGDFDITVKEVSKNEWNKYKDNP